jgi:hypothetical protein
MADDAPEVPEGAAVFPLIPAELAVHPLLLAVLHATVFLAGSEEDVVNGPAAAETLEYLATYLQRLAGPDLERVRADLCCLSDFARQEKWPKAEVQFLKSFLADFGAGGSEGSG